MALEDKVQKLEADIQDLGQRIQNILVQLEMKKEKEVSDIKPPHEIEEEPLAPDMSISTGPSGNPTRPLSSNNILSQPNENRLSNQEYAEILMETFEELEDDEFFDELFDFSSYDSPNAFIIQTGKSNSSLTNPDSEVNGAQPKDAEEEEFELENEFDEAWDDIEIDRWVGESYAKNDSCYQQFRFLFHWVEDTVDYIGQQKMLRTLNLYNRHGYIPDQVYHLLRDVIKLVPRTEWDSTDTHKIINALMELNCILEGDIRIGMNELMEIVGQT